MIRKSTADDKEQIQQLMQLCFGDKKQFRTIRKLRG